MNFFLINEHYLTRCKTRLVQVLNYFNEKVVELVEAEEILEIVKLHFEILLQDTGSLLNDTDFKILLTFFKKLLGNERGFEEFRKIIVLIIQIHGIDSEAFKQFKYVSAELDISIGSIIIPYLQEEIMTFLRTASTSESIFTYNGSKLLNFINGIKRSRLLNRTEMLIVNAFTTSFTIQRRAKLSNK